MRYEEIIGLNDYFQPVYDLENEIGTYWKQFIPNEKFYKVLSETINSLESSKPEERKSIWLQGAYGTGKSHATAVVKHILFDDLDEINDFIENLEEQIKFKIKNFRKNKRAFPVVLKGTSSIIDNRTFALVLEKAVKNALKKEGIELNTKTDFDKMIKKLKSDEINWEKIFKGTELEIYGTKEDIISKLQQGDITILRKIENILSQKGIHFSTENIANWLVEVQNELKNKEIADYLVIYWDEFTGILELPKSGLLLTELQNIAELSINKGVYLFVVAHRKPYQTNISRDDVEKVLGRFKVLDYSMEPITTYHIINAAIKKKDMDKFTEIKDKYMDSVKSLIEEITGSEGTQVQKSLESLFPIHPYTAYLATFIARNIGSTERSIFNFLYDERSGFKKFIKENPGEKGRIFLTVDYLWDFFYEEFERMGSEKVYSVLEKFKLHKSILEEKGDEYLSVFKGALLLNFLYRFVEVGESSLVVPSEKNIINLFAGAIDRKYLTSILSFIDDKQIINKTPDNLYLITSSGLPSREVETEKNKIKSEYNTIDRILNRKQEKELQDTISASVNRVVEFMIMDASLNEHLIRRKIEKAFQKDYTIHLCLFLGKSEQELQQIKNILKEISNDDLRNIIFVVSEATLDDKTFNRFIEYKARAIVADKHNYPEERNINEEYARKIIDNWMNQVKSGYIEWFLQNESGKELMSQFSRKINEELSRKIFSYGLENIDGTQKNRNIWTYKRSKTSAEIFLFANNRKDIEEKTSKGPERYLREIIKDNNGEYIVDINLKIKDDVFENHPLKKMYLEIRKVFEKERDSGVFNLGDALRFLTKPPYGLYPNMINMAAIGFLMREYIGKLFEEGTGIPIQKEVMRDKILTLFDYWEKGTHGEKLEVRFGTEDEEELIEILKDLFKLKDVRSLNDARWKIREWVKKQGFPIWVFKFAENINENTKKAIDTIFELVQSIDRDLTYEKIKDYLNTIEDVKYDLDILIDRENPGELFKKWLKCIEGVEISSEDIGEVIGYIKRNMQEEVASWTEDKVREKVKDWDREKLKKQIDELEYSKRDDGITTSQHYKFHSHPISEEKVKNIKQQIESYSAERLKEILIKLIDEHPEIIETIEKYLEGS
ncbi:hypothetical protein AciM339_1352 [Aciduliprofundum sp. MAR08-339]|uniref:hypothetical protein n=1 Tax=Aciduliprofundum sp. (strain MAR08-339) TaxID=673860 RepID=UPI0002A48660|nr:hypothetical protein AciM339_1352 [Aciduliprofundum sp. MAR08-339]